MAAHALGHSWLTIHSTRPPGSGLLSAINSGRRRVNSRVRRLNKSEGKMTDLDSRQEIVDDEHLKLLSVGYIVSGVMTGFLSLMGLIYAGIGMMMSSIVSSAASSHNRPDDLPPEFMGAFLGIFGGMLFLFFV